MSPLTLLDSYFTIYPFLAPRIADATILYSCKVLLTFYHQVMTKSQNGMEKDSQMECLNFVEKLYFTIVDLFCRYKSDTNKNIAYINCNALEA